MFSLSLNLGYRSKAHRWEFVNLSNWNHSVCFSYFWEKSKCLFLLFFYFNEHKGFLIDSVQSRRRLFLWQNCLREFGEKCAQIEGRWNVSSLCWESLHWKRVRDVFSPFVWETKKKLTELSFAEGQTFRWPFQNVCGETVGKPRSLLTQ